MNKKVFIVSQTESYLTQRGKRHPNLADYLSSKGLEVEYFSSNFYHADKRSFSKEEVLKGNKEISYKLHIIRSLAYYKNIGIKRIVSNLQFSIKVYRFLKKEDLSNVIIIVPSRPVEMTLFLSRLKKRNPSIDIILDIRDVWPDAFNIKNKYLKKSFELYCNFFLKKRVNTFDKFVHTCPKFMSWLKKYAPNAQSTFIPLGYDPNRFNLKAIDSVVKLSKSNEKINFVYIGLLQFQIEILPFIKAIQKDSRFSLTIFGDDGQGEKYEQIYQYVKTNNINNISFKGTIPQDEVGNVLCKFDIGLMPMNAIFAFPNKVFDYIAMKLPIFSMGENDTSTFVEKKNIGWSTTFEIEEIRALLEKIGGTDKNDIAKYTEELFKIRDDYSRDNLYKQFYKKLEN